MSKFEVYKDKKGETRFRYRASNGEIVFSSEGYKAKASALKSIESIKKNVASAEVVEEEAKKAAAKPKAAEKPKASVKPKAAAAAAPEASAKAKAPKAKAAAKPKAPAKPKAAKPKAATKPKAK